MHRHCSAAVQIQPICRCTELEDSDFAEDGTIDLITLLVKTSLVPTRSEGRRAIEQGGVSIDGEKNHRHPTCHEKRRLSRVKA